MRKKVQISFIVEPFSFIHKTNLFGWTTDQLTLCVQISFHLVIGTTKKGAMPRFLCFVILFKVVVFER